MITRVFKLLSPLMNRVFGKKTESDERLTLTITPPDPALIELAKLSGSEEVDLGDGWTMATPPPPEKFDFRTFDIDGPPSARGEDIIRTALRLRARNLFTSGDDITIALAMIEIGWIDWQYMMHGVPGIDGAELNLEQIRILRRALLDMKEKVPACREHEANEGSPSDILLVMQDMRRCKECRIIGELDE